MIRYYLSLILIQSHQLIYLLVYLCIIYMEEGGNLSNSQRQEIDPECLFQILQEQDPNNPKEMTFFIKIVVTKEMRARMADIEKNKKEKMARIQQREKTAQVVALKEKCDAIRKMDAKTFEQQRRKNGGQNEVTKALAEYEHLQASREKFNFNLFQSFEMRGKNNNIKFFYSSGQKYLSIRINKNYFLNEMHFSRRDLFNVAITFTRTWQFDFHGMIRVLWRIYTESQKPFHYSLNIRSLDLISVTFDISYHDKRTYRFRYSPFQFRTSPIFKEDNQLTGYYQTISCIPQISSSSKGTISDQDFYGNQRFFIFDDLTDNNLFYKILNRTNLVYQIYTISKGTFNSNQGSQLQIDEFAKKSLGHFYFSSTRLKKIMFTWSFRQYVRNNRDKRLKQDDKAGEKKEIILHIPFQMDRDVLPNNGNVSNSGEPVYRMRMQIIQVNKQITYAVKQDLAYRLKQWYLLIKEMLLQRQKAFFQCQKQNLNRPRNQRDNYRAEIEDFQMYVQFTSRDRFDKFFIGFLLLVSTVLDRHYFTLTEDKDRKREDSKIVTLQTNESHYFSNKKQYIQHFHSVKLVFRHTYFPHMFWNSAKEEQKQTFYNYLQNSRTTDYRLKCGQWKLQRIMKIKKKLNIKSKQQAQVEQAELLSFPDDFKRYIGILIRHFPLRVIYKDILGFVEAIIKTCYMPQEETNLMNLNGFENILKSIINVLLQQYYYCQFKQKQQKMKENDKDKEKQKQDRQNNQAIVKQPRQEMKIEIDPVKKQKDKDKIQDMFSRVLIIKIITRGDVGFTPEEKLHFQVTFKLMQFKSVWQTRLKEGSVVLRIFDDRLEIERDYVTVHTIKGDIRTNKKIIDEANIRANLQACFVDPKSPISL